MEYNVPKLFIHTKEKIFRIFYNSCFKKMLLNSLCPFWKYIGYVSVHVRDSIFNLFQVDLGMHAFSVL